MERSDLTFPSGDAECAAWLYRPDGNGQDPTPLVILGHGLGATREMGLDAYARRFVEAGFTALVFDYRGFGDSGGEPRQWLDVKRQLADWQAAIDVAHTLDGIDPARIALFGSSFGGGHVLRAAAADPRVAAVISQCPFTSGLASTLAAGPRSVLKLVPAALHDLVAARLGRPPRRVALVGAPGSAALMTAPDAEPGYRALVPEGVEHDLEVDGRIALHITRQAPGRAAAKVRCPLLFAVCQSDTVAPAGPTLKYAAHAPRGEVRQYPIGHFDIYRGEAFEVAVRHQVEFLTRHLLPGRAS
ncbi:alpha/beta hydrolase [Nocardioides sp.]|uniref:alpha/beta hydrolase n=1 Tax=Nocardioides sp. TaxID=35761 RepID=UPI002736D432|nr:alpha/beta hydrolase [Nocardioides sp.]MDP3890060.1 alpha/beta fold hydrolase [Nocardioides sp.]